jgi:hypothetical protein
MAGKVLNFKVCSPLKLRSGLTGKKPAICHYSYNLPINVGVLNFFIPGGFERNMPSIVKWFEDNK